MYSRLQFISSAIFMTSSLSNFVNNLATGIHKIYLNMQMIIKIRKCIELNTNIVNLVLSKLMFKMI